MGSADPLNRVVRLEIGSILAPRLGDELRRFAEVIAPIFNAVIRAPSSRDIYYPVHLRFEESSIKLISP